MKQALEKEMIAGCVANDRRCQEQLYRHFFDKMLGFVMRYTSDQEEALHILNGGYLRIFKKIDQFEFKGSFEGWVRRIIYHAVADHFRSQKNKIHFLEIEDRDRPLPPAQLEQFYEADLLKLVDTLPNASQTVFRLYALEGYTHPEISKELGISVGTSKWHLSEARKKLKSLLSNNNEYRQNAK